MGPIRVTHFSDLLCVWAYISQIRIDELLKHFPGAVEMEYRTVHVFGNVAAKIASNWKDRGGLQAYAAHVQSVAEKFDHVALHAHVWLRNTPQSSLPTHLYLCALRLLDARQPDVPPLFAKVAWALREAFFRHARDISRNAVLLDVGETCGVPAAEVDALLCSGAAHAALFEDMELTRIHAVQASPTLLFNEGRQRLTGNVGYRIIEANMRELLDSHPDQLSWC